MARRERLKTEVHTGFRTHKSSGTVTPTAYISYNALCADYTDKGDNKGFEVDTITRKGGLINGESFGVNGTIFTDSPCDYFRNDPWAYGHLSTGSRPSDGALAQQTIARTNPSRSSMQALEALAEIREFGSMAHSQYLKRMQNLFKHTPLKRFRRLSDSARGILLIRFGIIPIVNDINTLLIFQTLVDKRVDEIERLRTRGLRRTIVVWTDSAVGSATNQIVQSNLVVLRATINKSTQVTIKGHIRWYANSNWLKSDATVRAVAQRAIAGYILDPLSLYEIMPWSWLIDYFTNLGDFVKGSRNMFDAHHDKVRLSIEQDTHTSSSNHSSSASIGFSPFEATYNSKERRATTPSLFARIDFITEDQLSILGALAALKSGL
jgi:hypothetical protein